MNIADLQFSLETGSLEIYVSGCNPPHCPNCHNKQLHRFDLGLHWSLWMNAIVEGVATMGSLCESIWLLGGEPLDQDETEVVNFLTALKQRTNLPVFLFTRRNIGQITERVLRLCDYVKTGRYKPDMGPGEVEFGIQMATANQHVLKVSEAFKF